MMIGGCQKKSAATNKDSIQTNDFYTEIIKEDILSNASTNLIIHTNENLTEPIQIETNTKVSEKVMVPERKSR